MEATRHVVHDGYLGGEVDQRRNTMVVQAISGSAHYFLLALACQVGAVHVGTNDNRKKRKKGSSYFG